MQNRKKKPSRFLGYTYNQTKPEVDGMAIGVYAYYEVYDIRDTKQQKQTEETFSPWRRRDVRCSFSASLTN